MIRPVNLRQYADALARRTPEPDEIRPDVWSLPLPLPEWAGMESTLSTVYLGHDGRVAIVDPGWDTPENRDRLAGWLAAHGRCLDDIELLLVSHLHSDHLGLAPWLHSLTGVPVAIHRTEVDTLRRRPKPPRDCELFDRWGVPKDARAALRDGIHHTFPELDVKAVRPVEEGDTLHAAGANLTVVHTPGHTSGSACFVDETNRLVITGDHVLPIVRPGLALGDDDPADPIGDYLRSLERLRPVADFEVQPGHEYRFLGLGQRLDDLADHHRRRSAQVERLLDEISAPTVWRIAEQISWTGGWGAVTGRLRRFALAQTEYHVRALDREHDLA